MSTAPTDIDDIRRRMAQIRRELHDDVQGVVAGAEAATNWKRWIRSYPWASIGVAFAVGYLIIPRKHREVPTIQFAHPDTPTPLAVEAPRVPEIKKKKKSLVVKGLGLLTPVILRAAQGYALQFFEQWMAQRLQAQGQQPFDFAAAFGGNPGQAPSPGPGPGGQPGGPRRF